MYIGHPNKHLRAHHSTSLLQVTKTINSTCVFLPYFNPLPFSKGNNSTCNFRFIIYLLLEIELSHSYVF